MMTRETIVIKSSLQSLQLSLPVVFKTSSADILKVHLVYILFSFSDVYVEQRFFAANSFILKS